MAEITQGIIQNTSKCPLTSCDNSEENTKQNVQENMLNLVRPKQI